MQSAIVAPVDPPAAQVRRRILPSAAMSPEERLAVYRGAYDARLAEALEADFPALANLLGPSLFAELCSLYIREHPSRSYTLNDLGGNLPGFLARLDGLRRPEFARDLAQLEWTTQVVFHEVETPALKPEEVAAVPPDAWPRAKLAMITALRLVELGHPVHLYADAVREGRALVPGRRRRTRLAVFRRDYSVRWMELEPPAFRVLSALAGGARVADAVRGVRGSRVFDWFSRWSGEGLFHSVVY
jgi:hypothetical protein